MSKSFVNSAASPNQEAEPSSTIDREIHRELESLTSAGRRLGATIDELCGRLQPVLLGSLEETAESITRIRCETNIGHQIRDEETGISVNIDRLRDLIARLGV